MHPFPFTIDIIRHFVGAHAIWAYIFIVIGVIAEGEISVILAGIFSHLGSLNIFISLLCALIGGASKSVIGYSIGSYLQRHHSRKPFLKFVERRVSYFLPRFNKKPFWSIFISRFFIFGIGWFTTIYSGYKKIALKIFVRAEAMSLSLWSVGMLALGSFFSYTALSISKDVRKFVLMIILFYILFVLLEKIVEFILEVFEEIKGGIQNIDVE
jgi:membrane protein DedA with SNARE-associated domain